MKTLPHIGTAEFLSLPDDGIEAVPAKIDTGADISAIWASNIHLDGEKLVFNLFAPDSAYYREIPVVTTAFRTVTVRNSFGHKELRYKIQLRVSIGTRRLRGWFTLADRSHNIYPILLGKNFLKSRFVVDVAQEYLYGQPGDGLGSKKVVVLGAHLPATKRFFAEVGKQSKQGITYECVDYDALVYRLKGAATSIVNTHNHDVDLASYSFAYFKTHGLYPEPAAAVAEYLRFKGRPFIDRELCQSPSRSKLTEYMQLSCHGLPLPESICATADELGRRLPDIAKTFGYPFVLKDATSDRGRNNYLISTEAEFHETLSKAGTRRIYIAQRYIPNDGFLRLYVLGGTIGLAVWRDAVGHEDPLKQHLNKPRGGLNASKVAISDVRNRVRDLAVSAAKCLDRQVAGVDLIQDKATQKWYILEVNNAPQLRSGSFIDEKVRIMAKFFDKELDS